MEEKITIEKHGRNAIVYSPNSVFAYEVTESTPEFDIADHHGTVDHRFEAQAGALLPSSADHIDHHLHVS